MKKLLLATVLALGLPSLTYAAPTKTVSNKIIQEANIEVKNAFCKDGKQGLIKLVSDCYFQNVNLEKCMLEDSALIVFDKQMNDINTAQTGNETTETGFLSDKAIETRAKIYFNPRFGSVKKAMTYFNRGGLVLIKTMSECGD